MFGFTGFTSMDECSSFTGASKHPQWPQAVVSISVLGFDDASSVFKTVGRPFYLAAVSFDGGCGTSTVMGG